VSSGRGCGTTLDWPRFQAYVERGASVALSRSRALSRSDRDLIYVWYESTYTPSDCLSFSFSANTRLAVYEYATVRCVFIYSVDLPTSSDHGHAKDSTDLQVHGSNPGE
jgi:hypothetical protein